MNVTTELISLENQEENVVRLPAEFIEIAEADSTMPEKDTPIAKEYQNAQSSSYGPQGNLLRLVNHLQENVIGSTINTESMLANSDEEKETIITKTMPQGNLMRSISDQDRHPYRSIQLPTENTEQEENADSNLPNELTIPDIENFNNEAKVINKTSDGDQLAEDIISQHRVTATVVLEAHEVGPSDYTATAASQAFSPRCCETTLPVSEQPSEQSAQQLTERSTRITESIPTNNDNEEDLVITVILSQESLFRSLSDQNQDLYRPMPLPTEKIEQELNAENISPKQLIAAPDSENINTQPKVINKTPDSDQLAKDIDPREAKIATAVIDTAEIGPYVASRWRYGITEPISEQEQPTEQSAKHSIAQSSENTLRHVEKGIERKSNPNKLHVKSYRKIPRMSSCEIIDLTESD